ncbi:MarR family transcriptional regulator [Psychrobacillus glaciei]|uniref:MarR family transcriptional regulator n=1 Tax=Psychrobacillus glaciei TaxID=2283160 RepID=A0A5J6SRN2_9BACI|nr:MarR family transcriptional regulator [Psychrobacillus glaciei]QFG00699.1 MarR family transcriptional regulator [Psychrobacillus glaciei]
MVQSKAPTASDLLQILFKTNHLLHQQFEKHIANYGIPDYLTGPRLRFLIVLEENPNIRMNDIAKQIGIQPRTVTQYVDTLEKEELLIRLPDPEDRRATLLQLTEAALPLIKKSRAGMSEAAEKLLEPLSDEQRIQFLTILSTLK